MPVLAAMSHGKTRWIAEAVGRPMNDFSDLGQSADGPCANARHQQKLREILRTAFGGGGEIAVQSPSDDVLWPDIVVGGHDEMR